MADNKNQDATKTGATGTDDTTGVASEAADTKRKRRVLRPAAEPTTLREQSEKAQARQLKPSRRSKTTRILGAPFRLIGRIFRPLGKFKFFRVVGYILAPPYIRNSVRELSMVTWPGTRTTWQLTYAVIVFSLIFGVIVAGVDYGLDKAFRAFILKQ